MAQDATEAVTEAAKSATDVAGMFTPDKLMGYWQTAQPVVIKLVGSLLILWIGMKVAKWLSNHARRRNLSHRPRPSRDTRQCCRWRYANAFPPLQTWRLRQCRG